MSFVTSDANCTYRATTGTIPQQRPAISGVLLHTLSQEVQMKTGCDCRGVVMDFFLAQARAPMSFLLAQNENPFMLCTSMKGVFSLLALLNAQKKYGLYHSSQ